MVSVHAYHWMDRDDNTNSMAVLPYGVNDRRSLVSEDGELVHTPVHWYAVDNSDAVNYYIYKYTDMENDWTLIVNRSTLPGTDATRKFFVDGEDNLIVASTGKFADSLNSATYYAGAIVYDKTDGGEAYVVEDTDIQVALEDAFLGQFGGQFVFTEPGGGWSNRDDVPRPLHAVVRGLGKQRGGIVFVAVAFQGFAPALPAPGSPNVPTLSDRNCTAIVKLSSINGSYGLSVSFCLAKYIEFEILTYLGTNYLNPITLNYSTKHDVYDGDQPGYQNLNFTVPTVTDISVMEEVVELNYGIQDGIPTIVPDSIPGLNKIDGASDATITTRREAFDNSGYLFTPDVADPSPSELTYLCHGHYYLGTPGSRRLVDKFYDNINIPWIQTFLDTDLWIPYCATEDLKRWAFGYTGVNSGVYVLESFTSFARYVYSGNAVNWTVDPEAPDPAYGAIVYNLSKLKHYRDDVFLTPHTRREQFGSNIHRKGIAISNLYNAFIYALGYIGAEGGTRSQKTVRLNKIDFYYDILPQEAHA